MSIIINSSPSGEPSVQDEMWWVVSSDNSGQTDFRYVFDVYTKGQQRIRVKLYPDPVTGKGYFDAGSIVRNDFSYEWFVPVNPDERIYLCQPNVSGEIALDYIIQVGEDVSGVATLNMASGQTRAYNWVPPAFQRRVNDATIMNEKWYTNRPLYANVGYNEKLLIPIKPSIAIVMQVDVYDQSNHKTSYNDPNLIPYQNSGFIQLDIGPQVLNIRFADTIIKPDTKYYEVSFNAEAGKFRVNLTCNPKYKPFSLYFLNHWGMFDTARFGLVSKLTKDVERKQYEQRDYRQGAGVTYFNENKVYHESRVNYQSINVFSYRLTMDAPTDAEWQWLAEVIDSPQIYAEIDGYYYPVTIKNSNYEYSTYINNKLRPFEIDIDVNQSRNSYLR
jgi:hypothetical protein